jgi:hypothetical protein
VLQSYCNSSLIDAQKYFVIEHSDRLTQVGSVLSKIIAGNESTYEYREWNTNISTRQENWRVTKFRQWVMLVNFVETFCVMEDEFFPVRQITNCGFCIEVT